MSLFGSTLHIGKSLRIGKNSIAINPVSPIYSLRELFFIFFSLFRGNTFCFISRVSFKTFFEPNGFCVNLLTRTFPRKNDKYPTNARVVVGVGIFPINSGKCLVKKSSELDHKVSVPRAIPVVVSRKCCLEIRAQEQVVSGQSVRSNAISVYL